MPFRAKTKDDDSLYRCARFCYGIVGDVLEFLPHTRESQRILVNLLSGRLAASAMAVAFLSQKASASAGERDGTVGTIPLREAHDPSSSDPQNRT